MPTKRTPRKRASPFPTTTSATPAPNINLMMADLEHLLYYIAIKSESGEVIIGCINDEVAQEIAQSARRCLAHVNEYWGNTSEESNVV